jgi:hypothetical protein
MKESYSHTTANEINFLRSARELIAERKYEKRSFTPAELSNVEDNELATFYQKYIETCARRTLWHSMDKHEILKEARKLLRDYI